MAQLRVYLCNDYAGLLSCDNQQRFSFQYDLKWIAKKNVPPLSLSMPLREDAYSNEKARPFFTNLLPESTVREVVARRIGVSPRNEFALLEALGGECAGAVSLLLRGVSPEKQSGYRELSPEKFHEIIQELPKKPFLAGEDGIRLSLAGAQDKLPVYMKGERVFLPQGSSPSSHIIKPGIKGIGGSIRNEAFCMALAERIGLTVPHVHVITTPDELYVIERYDRFCDEKGKVSRIHQEDFCQAIGLMAETKYEAEGGPSLADCFSLIDRFSTNPVLDRKALLEWIMFNYFIHNADAHAKNISLLLTPDKIRLAPFYDLMCTGVYEGINERLAMKIGNENRSQWIRSRHWERMAKEVGIGAKFVLRAVKEMADQIERAAAEIAVRQQAIWGPSLIVSQIQKIITRQVKYTRSSMG
ncbi:MAG: type II toxin-antitoxin system HipA family toxin [Deltaproteobacteria bacterium]|nr:type II toxin-antitoxin system HipA family toxin [Deltaproteobacteria bacterium]